MEPEDYTASLKKGQKMPRSNRFIWPEIILPARLVSSRFPLLSFLIRFLTGSYWRHSTCFENTQEVL